MNDNNYYIIHRWMISKLKLKGSELAVYAIIYGFSQDGRTEYRGGIRYLKGMTNYAESNIKASINSLTEKGLLKKATYIGRTNGLTAVAPDDIKPGKSKKKSEPIRSRSYDIDEVERNAMNNDIVYRRHKS